MGKNNERGSSIIALPVLVAFGLGEYFLGYYGGEHNADPGSEIRTVQQQNEQITTQLQQRFDPVSQLILNPDKDSFSFNTSDQDGVPEMCSGDYAVKQAVAMISGNLSCAHSVTISK